jgi:predicted ABC-type transport system involved in lysophospholipase L1 biosynthesis ATPase subunit
VLDIFQRLSADGMTLVVITHDENVASRAHRRLGMIDGVVSELGPAMAAEQRVSPR